MTTIKRPSPDIMENPRIWVFEHDSVLRVELILRVGHGLLYSIEALWNAMQVHVGVNLILCGLRERIYEAAINLSFLWQMQQLPLLFISVGERKQYRAAICFKSILIALPELARRLIMTPLA